MFIFLEGGERKVYGVDIVGMFKEFVWSTLRFFSFEG